MSKWRREMLNPETEEITVTGTPADIRREIKVLEKEGYYNLYCDRPVMREGRRYSVTYPAGRGGFPLAIYTVGRA